jgi:hypothetical protein
MCAAKRIDVLENRNLWLAGWYSKHHKTVNERQVSVKGGVIQFSQNVENEEDALALLSTRFLLGMNEP